MKQFTLIGCPLGHSMSPWIHEHLFAMSGQAASYSLTEIRPEDLMQAAQHSLRTLDGYNITIPHKVGIIPALDALDETAQRYESVNCVANRDGKAVGYNTDCVGFLRSVGDLNAGDRILLIGSGGVGRMMATEAFLKGAALTIVERDLPRAEALAQELTGKYPDAAGTIRVLEAAPEQEQFDLLMNACPVGMYPRTNACPVTDAVIANSSVCSMSSITRPPRSSCRKPVPSAKTPSAALRCSSGRRCVRTRSGTMQNSARRTSRHSLRK